MIIDKLISREDAYASGVEAGFAAGLEEAAQIHNDLAENWFVCAEDETSSVGAKAYRQQAGLHRKYARNILNLKERSNQDGSTDGDNGPSQAPF